MRPKDKNNFESLNLVTEYCTQNLMNVIHQNADVMTTKHIKYITYEMMKGVHYMHSRGVIHRDLKPLNLLVTEKWDIKISDFGQSNVITDEINKDHQMTKYITTKYYRAPELYMDYKDNYDSSVDMWAIGCIIAELFTKDVFIDASSKQQYLISLMTFLGQPEEKIRRQITKKDMLSFMDTNYHQVEV